MTHRVLPWSYIGCRLDNRPHKDEKNGDSGFLVVAPSSSLSECHKYYISYYPSHLYPMISQSVLGTRHTSMHRFRHMFQAVQGVYRLYAAPFYSWRE